MCDEGIRATHAALRRAEVRTQRRESTPWRRRRALSSATAYAVSSNLAVPAGLPHRPGRDVPDPKQTHWLSRGGIGLLTSRSFITTKGLDPVNGVLPVSISYSITPSE